MFDTGKEWAFHDIDVRVYHAGERLRGRRRAGSIRGGGGAEGALNRRGRGQNRAL